MNHYQVFLRVRLRLGTRLNDGERELVPSSSPALFPKLELGRLVGFPSAFTFFDPLAVSLDFAIFGYGIGISGAGDAGNLQGSGRD